MPRLLICSAADVTDLNALMNATTGTVTATIDGNAAELDDLQATGTTSTQALTITVDDAVTAAQGAAIADATSVATVDFSAAGVNDAFANLVNVGGGTVSADMAKVDAKDANVNVTVNDAALANMSAADVTDLNALLAATTGTVTATIDGNAAELDDLQATGTTSTQALTITVDDAQTGAAGVTALNTIAASTTGSVTATISGNSADLDDLTATGTTATQAYTITVNDTATVASGAAIADATNAATVDFSAGGITDSFGAVVDGTAVSANMQKVMQKTQM